jgi:hypothetical protein
LLFIVKPKDSWHLVGNSCRKSRYCTRGSLISQSGGEKTVKQSSPEWGQVCEVDGANDGYYDIKVANF